MTTFILEIKSRPEVVSIDRVKPANVTLPSTIITQEQQETPSKEPLTSTNNTLVFLQEAEEKLPSIQILLFITIDVFAPQT